MYKLLYIILSCLLQHFSIQTQPSKNYESNYNKILSNMIFNIVSSQCNNYTTCFECYSLHSNCAWIANKCVQNNSSSYREEIIDAFTQCEQEDPNYIQQTFSDVCFGMNNTSIPLYATINKNIDGTFGKHNSNNNDIIYCLWNVYVSSIKKKVKIKLSISKESLESNDLYLMELIHEDNRNNKILLDNQYKFNFKETGIREIKFRYLGKNVKRKPPFNLNIQYSSESKKIDGIKIFIIIFALFIGIFLIGCLIFFIYEKFHNKIKDSDSLDTNNIKNKTQETKSNLCLDKNKFIIVCFNTEMKIKGTNCTICLEMFLSGKKVLQLACGHFFHIHCIIKWFGQFNKKIPKCPNCNKEIKSFVFETKGFVGGINGEECTKTDENKIEVSCRRYFIYKYK